MMKLFFFLLLFGPFTFLNAQDFDAYSALTEKADSLLEADKPLEAANNYSAAFKVLGWKGFPRDRFGAACAWSLAAQMDSCYYMLYRLVDSMEFSNVDMLKSEKKLSNASKDKRWKSVIAKAKKHKAEEEKYYDKKLISKLRKIDNLDQKYRLELDSISDKFGFDSKEVKAHWKVIERYDSLNLIQVRAILDKRGWLGPEVVGWKGSTTLFLVIQHSDLKVQETYIPMFREAVKNKKASASSLALMEDRVALGQGKLQTYGSQIGQFKDTGKYYVLPLEDPDNVDARRATMGLQPLADYIRNWDLTWDVEAYKKQIPELLEIQKSGK